jgi:hypothetical protein
MPCSSVDKTSLKKNPYKAHIILLDPFQLPAFQLIKKMQGNPKNDSWFPNTLTCGPTCYETNVHKVFIVGKNKSLMRRRAGIG